MKVKIRISGTKKEVMRLRKHLLKNHPQMIMSNPREGTNPKYKDNQQWFCYGDYEFNKVRRRRTS
jgi:hypothetical protein